MKKNKPNSNGKVYRLSISDKKGDKKRNISVVTISIEHGIIGDAHGTTERQISLLPIESFSKLETVDFTINPGDFAENITTEGLDFNQIQVGTSLRLGADVCVQIIQIGKECHENCIIREKVGDCIMPREGIFAKVLQAGEVHVGDPIEILPVL